ncbi:DUF928 domain-containing protein, partial [Scytonema sp. NUACC26]|uniref:DUF928 domain-containing protein n=1 Tax=Scytonema sp. NUACC26 TaxID=3140176 RepID=UPI0038B24E42
MRKQLLNPWLVTSCVLSLYFTTASLAVARYIPPRGQKPPSDYSRTGGGRGCPEDKIPLTILAPKTHIGETTSRYPTFAWFVSNAYPVDLRIFEFDSNNQPSKPIGEPVKLSSSAGINKYSLPENQPGLTVGQKYLWQAAIKCPQGYLVERAEFRVVEIPSSLTKQLSVTKDGTKKVDLYAEAGLWYNALDEALKLSDEKKPATIVSTLLQDLTALEAPNATDT